MPESMKSDSSASAPNRDALPALIAARSFARGEFKLASGKTSSLYFNLKPTMMHAEGAHLAAIALYELIAPLKPDFIGGLEMGAVPLLSGVAAESWRRGAPIGAFFVRKKAKEHGAKQLVEGLAPGESLAGKRIVMAEDVTTTGGSVLQAIEAARADGAEILAVASLLDRQEGARELLAAQGVELVSVFTAADFV
jgi:orotate phosphoribosyltransferase